MQPVRHGILDGFLLSLVVAAKVRKPVFVFVSVSVDNIAAEERGLTKLANGLGDTVKRVAEDLVWQGQVLSTFHKR